LSQAITVQYTKSQVPSGKTGHLNWHEPAGSLGNMNLLHRASQMLFNFLTQVIPLGCPLVCSLVCLLLKLPFENLIFRMGFGRANRAPVGRYIYPAEKVLKKNRTVDPTVGSGTVKKKNCKHTHIHKYLGLFGAQLGFSKPSVCQTQTLVLFIFYLALHFRGNVTCIFLIQLTSVLLLCCINPSFVYQLIQLLLFNCSFLWQGGIYVFCFDPGDLLQGGGSGERGVYI
jgi:hypothetical protein